MNQIQQWWQTLESRERLVIMMLVLLVLIVMFRSFVWNSVYQQHKNALNSVKKQSELLSWMQQRSSLVRQLNQNSSGQSIQQTQSISQRLNQSANQLGIKIKRYQLFDDQSVQVWLNNTEARVYFKWLQTLKNDYGMVMQTLTINESSQAGLITVRMTLTTR